MAPPPARSGAHSMERVSMSSASTGSLHRRSSSQQARPRPTACPIVLWTHEPPNFSPADVVIHPELPAVLGGVGDAELLEIRSLAAGSADTSAKGRRFLFRATTAVAEGEALGRAAGNLQLSISRSIAGLYGLHNRCDVLLSKVPRDPHTISHVELYFRDQYVGRADMWRLAASLEDTCVYVGQRITLAGCVRATVGRIFIDAKKVTSGFVAPHTRTIFRSESAKYNLLIQLGREMWEFDEDGELYFEKAISGFIPELLRRWNAVPTNHVVSVVLFARVYYDVGDLHMLEDAALPVRKSEDGRWYIDYYKVIVDLEGSCDWAQAVTSLKEEFFRFQHDILLLRRPVAGPAGAPWAEDPHADLLRRDRALLAGRLSASHEGNILEALNLALNPADAHFVDRDLTRTGLDVVVVSAGTGHFRVDKRLLRLTTERMIDSGFGLDLVCLTKMPLHSVPLFHFKSEIPEARTAPHGPASATGSRGRRGRGPSAAAPSSAPPDPLYFDPLHASSTTAGPGAGTTHTTAASSGYGLVDFYSIPHWVDCSFYNLQQDKPFRADRFVPRCKMHEVQMMGIMENEISDISIPYLELGSLGIPGLVAAPKSMGSSMAMSGGRDRAPRGLQGSSLTRVSEGETGLDLAGMGPREARRLMRERFDRETMRDLETAPAAVRSSLVYAASGRVPAPSTSPSRSLHHNFSNEQLRQRAREQQAAASSSGRSPVTPGRIARPGRHSRDTRKQSTMLEAHDEHPADRMEGATHTTDGTAEQHANASTALSSPNSPNANRFSAVLSDDSIGPSMSRALSRASSFRSLNTLSRGLRPLEPIGKARALVAPSDVLPDEMDGPVAPTTSPVHPSASAALMKNSKAGSKSSSRYRSPANWLWSSFRSSLANPPHEERHAQQDPTSPPGAASASKEGIESSTAASRRIAALLASSRPTSSSPAPSVTSPSSAEKSPVGKEESAPSPIAIPPAMPTDRSSDGKHHNAQDAPGAAAEAAEEQAQREQDAYEQALEEEEARARYAQCAQVEKQTLVNPSNPRKSLAAKATNTQLMRWQHLFPRRLNHHAVKWRSMTSPACLPLTTLYLPTESDLASQWLEYPYTMSISSEMNSFLVKRNPSTHPALAVLREMASQRLAQGYQFIVPAGGQSESADGSTGPTAVSSRSLVNDKPRPFVLRQPSELFQPGNLVSGNPIFLSVSNQIHRIAYDRQIGSINVKRYVRRTEHETSPLEYACCVWPRDLPGYQTVRATFHYPDFGAYNWTYLDALIAGHSDEERFIESLRYWRTRFVVVPSEGPAPPMRAPTGEALSDEEIRLIGMDRLADLFARARLRPRTNEDRSLAPLRFIPTSLDPAASFHDADFMRQMTAAIEESNARDASFRRDRSAGGGRRRPIKDLDLRSIAVEMRSDSSGLRINDKFWQRVLYEDSFTGADLVTWLCRNFPDVKMRDDAVEVGARLLREGLFEHVNRAHGFLDGYYFYRLRPEYSSPRTKKWFASGSRPSTEDGSNAGSRPGTGGGSRGASRDRAPSFVEGSSLGRRGTLLQNSQGRSSHQRRKLVKLSRTHIIDIDPSRRSDRAEVAFLHHDVAHNPANGFNFQIHWLGTTARFIEDAVQAWTRTVERYGLRLIEAPIGQIADVTAHNPFQAPLQIALALSPPAPSAYLPLLAEHVRPEHYFEWALLRRFGFILDQEASDRFPEDVDIVYDSRPKHFEYSQFVHRSGVAFVQVVGGAEGFLWLNNRLFTSHLSNTTTTRQRNERDGPLRGGGAHASSSPAIGAVGASGAGSSGNAAAPQPDAESVRREFSAFCADAAALELFYRSVLASLGAEVQLPSNAAAASTDGDVSDADITGSTDGMSEAGLDTASLAASQNLEPVLEGSQLHTGS